MQTLLIIVSSYYNQTAENSQLKPVHVRQIFEFWHLHDLQNSHLQMMVDKTTYRYTECPNKIYW